MKRRIERLVTLSAIAGQILPGRNLHRNGAGRHVAPDDRGQLEPWQSHCRPVRRQRHYFLARDSQLECVLLARKNLANVTGQLFS